MFDLLSQKFYLLFVVLKIIYPKLLARFELVCYACVECECIEQCMHVVGMLRIYIVSLDKCLQSCYNSLSINLYVFGSSYYLLIHICIVLMKIFSQDLKNYFYTLEILVCQGMSYDD